MLARLKSLVPSAKTRNVAYTAGGMLALLAGRKVIGLSLFAKGAMGVEKAWREAHPDFEGDLMARWEEAISFYEETHQNEVNRKLHVIGIPMILGGAAGLIVFSPYRPLWFVSASSFTAGWVLNIIGHGLFEKNAPAFADDPLSFLAGPVWDFKHGGQDRSVKNPESRPDALMHEDINVGGALAQA